MRQARDHMNAVITTLGKSFFKPVLMVDMYPYYFHAAGLIWYDRISQHFLRTNQFIGTAWLVIGTCLTSCWMLSILRCRKRTLLKLGITWTWWWPGASSWPSAGNDNFTTPMLAAMYDQNLIRRFARRNGTPAQPKDSITGWVCWIQLTCY